MLIPSLGEHKLEPEEIAAHLTLPVVQQHLQN